MALKFVQSNTLYLAGSGVTVGATSITLTTFTDIYGNVLTMTDFGAKGYITLEPDTTNEEGATFTGVTANANGTYTLTGVSTILAKSPYTETSGLVRAHSGGTKVVITDNVAFWNKFGNLANANTWDDVQTFSVPAVQATQPTASGQVANKAYVDGVAIAGAPNASTTVKGIGTVSVAPVSATAPIFVGDNDTRVPTAGQAAALPGNNASIAVGSGNKYVTQTGLQRAQEIYAADSVGTDAYAVTLSPAPTAYVTGMVVNFKAGTANTGAATLNVNGLGAITIVKAYNQTLNDNDIKSGQLVTVIYDGTNFQMQSQLANVPPSNKIYSSVTSVSIASSTAENTLFTTTIAGGTLGSTNAIRFYMPFTAFRISNTKTATIRVKYGATTMISRVYTAATATEPMDGVLDGFISANAATNSQSAYMHVSAQDTAQPMVNTTAWNINSMNTGTAAIDSTANQTFSITIQFNNSSASDIITAQSIIIDKIAA